MNSVLLDSSFLISLSDDRRADHEVAKTYFYAFVERSVVMYLSTIVICEYEVKQRITDLGMHNFVVLPFNFEDAIVGAMASATLHPLRNSDDDRTAVSADSKIIGQCITSGAEYFATGDERCCKRIETAAMEGCSLALPKPISTRSPFDPSWFNGGQHELIA